jgi:DNA mismatch repair protein MSH2
MSERAFDETHAAVLFGKRQGQKFIGAAVRRRVDSKWVLELFEFCDNDQYSNFDAFLVQLGSCTVYITDDVAASKHEARKVFALLEKDGVLVHEVKRGAFFRKSEVQSALAKLVGSTTHSITVAESEREFAYPAVDCLVQKLSLLDDVDTFGTYGFMLSSLDVFMKLDSAAVDALCLLPKADMPSQYGSIFGVLNRCRTKIGVRLLDRWIRQPLTDYEQINRRLDLVEVLKNSTVNRNRLVDGPLKGVPDVDSVIERMHRKRAGLAEVYRLYLFFKTLPAFISVLSELDNATEEQSLSAAIREKFTEPLESISSKLSVYQQLVEHVIDMNRLPDLVVNAAHSQDLQDLKVELDKLDQKAYSIWEVLQCLLLYMLF